MVNLATLWKFSGTPWDTRTTGWEPLPYTLYQTWIDNFSVVYIWNGKLHPLALLCILNILNRIQEHKSLNINQNFKSDFVPFFFQTFSSSKTFQTKKKFFHWWLQFRSFAELTFFHTHYLSQCFSTFFILRHSYIVFQSLAAPVNAEIELLFYKINLVAPLTLFHVTLVCSGTPVRWEPLIWVNAVVGFIVYTLSHKIGPEKSRPNVY